MVKEVQIKTPLIDTKYVDVNEAKTRKKSFEVVDSSSETEQAGYIPPQKQIENMILAGQRLDQSRMQYDFDSEEDIDEEATDPTRVANYDLADASQAQIALSSKQAEKALKPSQAVQEPPEGVFTPSKEVDVPPPDNGA